MGWGARAATEVTLTIAPERRSRRGVSSTGPQRLTPALLTRISTGPSSAIALATVASSVMSATTRPTAGRSASDAASRSSATISCPRRASSCTVARPMPEPPPVTSARAISPRPQPAERRSGPPSRPSPRLPAAGGAARSSQGHARFGIEGDVSADAALVVEAEAADRASRASVGETLDHQLEERVRPALDEVQHQVVEVGLPPFPERGEKLGTAGEDDALVAGHARVPVGRMAVHDVVAELVRRLLEAARIQRVEVAFDRRPGVTGLPRVIAGRQGDRVAGIGEVALDAGLGPQAEARDERVRGLAAAAPAHEALDHAGAAVRDAEEEIVPDGRVAALLQEPPHLGPASHHPARVDLVAVRRRERHEHVRRKLIDRVLDAPVVGGLVVRGHAL